jgi:mannose-1-phosphate guanylyltransferase
MSDTHLIPVILCGGAGSRLWPVSREAHPKPFIRLADGQSLLQKAFLRATRLPDVSEVVTVTNREFFFKTVDEFREVCAANQPATFILEPCARNTAAAVAAAVLHVAEKNPQDILLVLPADHLITDQDAFASAVAQATSLARAGFLVTFGIQPLAPETGYGYIEAEGNKVIRFVEKPDREAAQQYLQAGNFYWNAGIFCFAAQTMLDEMQKHCSAILEQVQVALSQGPKSKGEYLLQRELDCKAFAQVPENSLDYAVMEKTRRAAVVPCDIGWSDIGSWSALSELVQADSHGNRVEGKALLKDTENCYIRSEDRIVGTVGIKELIIVDTPDALLVAHKDRAQDVKHIYQELKALNHEAHRFHRTVHRPWGSYAVLEEGERYKIKRIVVKPGASLSLQMHHHRSEHWVVVSGMAKVSDGEHEAYVAANQSTYIPAGRRHRVSNPGKIDLVMIEVQSGEYLGEDDIIRFDDVYGRT